MPYAIVELRDDLARMIDEGDPITFGTDIEFIAEKVSDDGRLVTIAERQERRRKEDPKPVRIRSYDWKSIRYV